MCFQIIVSAVPIRNIKDELKNVAAQSLIRMNQEAIKRFFSMANNMDMEKIQLFVDYWVSRSESLAQDNKPFLKIIVDFKTILSKYPQDSLVKNLLLDK